MKKNNKNNNRIFTTYKNYKKHYFSNDSDRPVDDSAESPDQFGRRLAEESLVLIRKNLK